MSVVPVAACAPDRLEALFAGGGWPAFIDADVTAAAALPRIRATFGQHELALVEDDEVIAAGWGVPIAWNGDPAGLPTGYSASLVQALADHDRGEAADTFVLCALQVGFAHAGRAVASRLLTAFVEHARTAGLPRVVAPLRPTLKHRYPLTPIDAYADWAREDGQPFDPWLRLHRRLGARTLGTTVESQTFTGTVTQWQTWSGLSLPASGRYVVPDALAPLVVDHDTDFGTCTEPGIWVQHR